MKTIKEEELKGKIVRWNGPPSEILSIEKQTEKALLLKVNPIASLLFPREDKIWVPKSVLENPRIIRNRGATFRKR